MPLNNNVVCVKYILQVETISLKIMKFGLLDKFGVVSKAKKKMDGLV